jgi:peptide/nickel transport system substrate-binding protein
MVARPLRLRHDVPARAFEDRTMKHWRALALGCIAAMGVNAAVAQSTLRIVLLNDLASLDPVQTTAGFARNHGYLVYDQLFALDSAGNPQPQMVESFGVSADGKTYRFTPRESLTFHDGAPVTAADAVQSIRRWSERDVVGRALAAATASLSVVDARTLELTLSRHFALVTEALPRSTTSALFVMPERLARTPAVLRR